MKFKIRFVAAAFLFFCLPFSGFANAQIPYDFLKIICPSCECLPKPSWITDESFESIKTACPGTLPSATFDVLEVLDDFSTDVIPPFKKVATDCINDISVVAGFGPVEDITVKISLTEDQTKIEEAIYAFQDSEYQNGLVKVIGLIDQFLIEADIPGLGITTFGILEREELSKDIDVLLPDGTIVYDLGHYPEYAEPAGVLTYISDLVISFSLEADRYLDSSFNWFNDPYWDYSDEFDPFYEYSEQRWIFNELSIYDPLTNGGLNWLDLILRFSSAISLSIHQPSPFQNVIEEMYDLLYSSRIPDHFTEMNPEKTGDETEFDVNEFFTILDRLSMAPGYTLDYVYHFDGMGGWPRLYARKTDDTPFRTFADLGITDPFYDPNPYEYLDKVEIEDTAEGYFQFALFRMLGDKFYLYWHSYYAYIDVVCDYNALFELLHDASDYNVGLSENGEMITPRNLLREARRYNLTPVIIINENDVDVRIVAYSAWIGLYYQYFTFSRQYPHRLLLEGKQILIPYTSNVVF